MPVTSFHFGPGAAIHAFAPRHVSFLAFCAANVVIDVEPLYFMVTGQAHLHRFLHTYVGASMAAAFTVALFLAAHRLGRARRLPDPFEWQSLSMVAVALGAVLGAWSHIVLDSVMHGDITPFAPFSDANPLFRVISLAALHWLCILAGALALVILGIRRRAFRRTN
jgi:membrane-bound metal-dependent hydrolase YbcI (DUF457 family)